MRVTPLSHDALDYAAPFHSEQCAEGFVAIARNTLRILALERLGTVFNQVVTPLQYTPRKLVVEPKVCVFVLEGLFVSLSMYVCGCEYVYRFCPSLPLSQHVLLPLPVALPPSPHTPPTLCLTP